MKNLKLFLALMLSSFSLHGMNAALNTGQLEAPWAFLCDPLAYEKVLQNGRTGDATKDTAYANFFLIHGILQHCLTSKKLKDLVEISLNHGGKANIALDALAAFVTVIGTEEHRFLAEQTPETAPDVAATVRLLIKSAHLNGTPCDLTNLLLRTIENRNVLVARILLAEGAHPNQEIIATAEQCLQKEREEQSYFLQSYFGHAYYPDSFTDDSFKSLFFGILKHMASNMRGYTNHALISLGLKSDLRDRKKYRALAAYDQHREYANVHAQMLSVLQNHRR